MRGCAEILRVRGRGVLGGFWAGADVEVLEFGGPDCGEAVDAAGGAEFVDVGEEFDDDGVVAADDFGDGVGGLSGGSCFGWRGLGAGGCLCWWGCEPGWRARGGAGGRGG